MDPRRLLRELLETARDVDPEGERALISSLRPGRSLPEVAARVAAELEPRLDATWDHLSAAFASLERGDTTSATRAVLSGARPTIAAACARLLELGATARASAEPGDDAWALAASGTCHDLNNLLFVVDSAIELARRHLDAGGDPRPALGEAKAALERAGELNHRLGALVRDRPSREAMSLVAVIRDTASYSLVGRRTALELDVDDGLWPVEADAGQISQVVQNLVTNAAEAMGDEGRVIVEALNVIEPPEDFADRSGPHVLVRVRDHGPGVPSELRDRLFEPFYTTKPRGSGLGLVTSRSIVLAHAGRLELRGEPGAGAVFEIWLPARPAAE